MIEVQYPRPQFRIKTEGDKRYLFDPIRRTWLLLTDEEWVRQNFVNYLVSGLGYPASFVALEKEIRLGELRKRFDVLVYDAAHRPWMLVECKAATVSLGEETLQQALRYHVSVPVSYIIITNGASTAGWKKDEGKLTLLNALPFWNPESG